MINRIDQSDLSAALEKINRLEQEITRLAAENIQLKQNTPSVSDQSEFFSLREIISLMPGTVFWKNKDGVYLGCNNNLAEFLNLVSADEIIGKRNCDLMDPEYANALDTIDAEIMESNEPRFIEEAGHTANKQPAIFFTQKTPLRNWNGDVVGLLGISIDITERKKIEKELSIAKEKAESSNRAKSQFLAVVNHELRTPLTGIIGLINILKNGNAPEHDEFNTVDNLASCAHYLLTLVNDILDFTKLEAGKIALTDDAVNLGYLVKEIYSVLAALAKNKNLELRTDISNDIPDIITDLRLLRQILINIVSNAIKFTENGHIEIKVHCIKQTATHATVEMIIRDTGQGIPPDKLEQIFEPFKQLEDTYIRQSSRSGTGLGLAIVKRLTAMLNTEIHVESKLGEGSIFTLVGEFKTSPKSATTNMRREIPDAAIKALPQTTQKTIKALLIEDDQIVQHVHKALLGELGCEVNAATYGRDALDMFNNHDIIFVDIGLSDMTGFEVIKALREHPKAHKSLPIIALTGYTGAEEKLACLMSGADEVAAKPISSDSLKEILTRYLGI